MSHYETWTSAELQDHRNALLVEAEVQRDIGRREKPGSERRTYARGHARRLSEKAALLDSILRARAGVRAP